VLISALLLALTLSAPPEVMIDSDSITLGALIPFPSNDARAAVSLGYAPNPGLSRRIAKYEITGKLIAAGMAADDLQIPEYILVRRSAAGLNRDQVTRAILNAFTKQYPDANVEISSVELPAVQVGTGPLEISASLPPRVDLSNAVFVRVEVRGTSFSRNLFIRTNVNVEAEQPVLKNKVAAHSEIQPNDIEWKLAPVRGAAVEDAQGMLAKRDLEPGQVLTADLLYTPLYVHKGDSVTVKATAGAVTISATMRAKASGKFGDTIQVEHLSGEGTATAKVIGPRTLETLGAAASSSPTRGASATARSLK
jgi:flagella basal body P-ring formation protein FlgA